jgi:hypothetical protein
VTDLQRRLLYILHRGLVEIRLLAKSGQVDQAADLADLLEVIPGWLIDETKALPRREIENDLKAHEEKYARSFKYSDFIDRYEPPDF